ncbi:MAG: ribosome hibernation-promoting factor, HPF/YfiA family [Thermoleophilia bacterium]
MKIQIKGRNVAVTDAMQEYAEEKLSRVHRLLQERHIDEVSRVELELMVEKNPSIANPNIAEATIFTRGPVIRAKESSTDMYASIDLVADKLQRRVKKYHDKVHRKNPRHGQVLNLLTSDVPEEETTMLAADEIETDDGHIVKTKQFALKPMTVDEATLQLELVGHDFFVFTNVETSDTNVVYRRNDGHYGLIEPAQN